MDNSNNDMVCDNVLEIHGLSVATSTEMRGIIYICYCVLYKTTVCPKTGIVPNLKTSHGPN